MCAGRPVANAEDSLFVYIQYKPAPYFKLLVPLVCHEVETSQVDRLEVDLHCGDAHYSSCQSSLFVFFRLAWMTWRQSSSHGLARHLPGSTRNRWGRACFAERSCTTQLDVQTHASTNIVWQPLKLHGDIGVFETVESMPHVSGRPSVIEAVLNAAL